MRIPILMLVSLFHVGGLAQEIITTYAPASPGLGLVRAVAFDAKGCLYVADQINHRVQKVDTATGVMTTLAGNGGAGFSGDGGPSSAAVLNQPRGLGVDGDGNVFIADAYNHRVRRVDAVTGIITTVAGNGVQGYGGDGGPATSASFNTPIELAFDAANNVYVNDENNHRIRKVDKATGVITTFAGNGSPGFSGDGGPATDAMLSTPSSIVFDPSWNLYVADRFNHRVRMVAAGTGTITTVAGTGTGGHSGDGGPAAAAELNNPIGLDIDSRNSLYIVDHGSNYVRRMDLGSGTIATVAGNGVAGFSGDGGIPTSASLNLPVAVAFDAAGDMYIADFNNRRVRKIYDPPPAAADDAYSANEDEALRVAAPGVLANDSDPAGDPMTATLCANPSHGQVSLGPDGSFSYAPDPNFFGNDSFAYRAGDGKSSSGIATVTVRVLSVNDPPTVTLSATPMTTGVGYDVCFVATGDDAEGQELSYSWDFGDGTRATGGATATHAFQSSGAYPVSVTVTDTEGATAVATVGITVVGGTAQDKKAPHAVIGGPRIASVGQEVVLDGSGSHDDDGEIVSYLWAIDGEESLGPTVAGRFWQGTHIVLLTVTDDDGLADVARAEVVVLGASDGNGNCSPTKKTSDPVLYQFKYASCLNDAQAMSQVKFSTNNLGIMPGSRVAVRVGTNQWGKIHGDDVQDEILIDDKGQYQSKDRNVQAEIKASDGVARFKFMQREFDDVLDYRGDKSKDSGTMEIPVQVVVTNGGVSSFFDFAVPVGFKVKENQRKGEFAIFGKFDRKGL
jgi:PKD repeat protein